MRSLASIPRGYWWIAAGVAFVIVAAWFIWANYFETYHYAKVDQSVYRDGFRTFREFQTGLGRSQAKQVICLLDENELTKEPFNQESEYCRRSKIKFSHIGIKLGGWPTSADVQLFLQIATSKDDRHKPVLIHCAQGVRRTGMMVAAYQMSVMGWDKAKTKAAMLTFGHSQRTVGDVMRFIDEYDPVTRTVREDLPVGQE